MKYEKKLAIARQCYQKIKQTIEECYALGAVGCCWDECIWVDDELFTERVLREDKDNSHLRSEWGGTARCITSDGRNVNIAEELNKTAPKGA